MQDESNRSEFSVQRMYVVKLVADAHIRTGRFAGHVEHVATGEAASFSSLEALVDFMARYGEGGINT